MIKRQNNVEVGRISTEDTLLIDGNKDLFKHAIFFDLEHYIYKKPMCVGVFGCCYYDEEQNKLMVTQYMVENKSDIKTILYMARDYFKMMYSKYKKIYIITFSGNNDFTVINYLFQKYNIDFNISEYFTHIDLQKQYEKEKKESIGLKALEKQFSIFRDSELISGSNLAKTFSKIIKDDEYINRMPVGKREKILLYNEQDVVSLFHICVKWSGVVNSTEEEEKEEGIQK